MSTTAYIQRMMDNAPITMTKEQFVAMKVFIVKDPAEGIFYVCERMGHRGGSAEDRTIVHGTAFTEMYARKMRDAIRKDILEKCKSWQTQAQAFSEVENEAGGSASGT